MHLALLILGNVAAQGSGAAPLSVEPTQLFRDACMAGSARLKRGSATQVSFPQVPNGAWVALGQTRAGLHHAERVPGKVRYTKGPRPAQRAEILGAIYRIGAAKETFLLLPAARGEGDFARSCVVVWKGQEYLKARRAIIGPVNEGPGQIMLPNTNNQHYGYTFQESGDFMISIVTYQGWTALIGAPKPSTKPKAVR